MTKLMASGYLGVFNRIAKQKIIIGNTEAYAHKG
jgi:hypothetical protein